MGGFRWAERVVEEEIERNYDSILDKIFKTYAKNYYNVDTINITSNITQSKK